MTNKPSLKEQVLDFLGIAENTITNVRKLSVIEQEELLSISFSDAAQALASWSNSKAKLAALMEKFEVDGVLVCVGRDSIGLVQLPDMY